jgi:CheY-like chemotaxis protein
MEQRATAPTGATRVLLVDDDKIVCQTLAVIFANRGYETRTAESGEAALELIAGWAPDVAILDVGLPRIDGVQLASLIRQQFPRCHILLFSGRPESAGLVDEASSRGESFEIAAKPVHPDFLLQWVKDRTERAA